ncbi:YgdI/YgdR family lipoprotein [Curtobacterium flaccumfaciens]|uniref:YgdI/YgdR family lipoprotein n=1 Tax=Curtobacterium flaccumfaciens TaxID=2035 RepID=UPI0021FE8D95|nr:YgdI/YgdR family lipoprotein [Curtobacterium flaccumfaciens]UWD83674.1 YgdI/YgdR family lipoprotein [Curtobacterium flaccumfaciens]
MKILPLAATALVFLALAGCASTTDAAESTPTPTPEGFRAIGTIQVPMDLSATLPLQDDNPTIGNPCIPKSGYDDIDEGSQVVVSNARGEKIALGSLEEGTLANGPSGDAFFQSVCQFAFSVDDIPDEGRIYSVHVGNENRGEQSYSRTDLQSGISLTIG